jgi:hypothetical protein
LFAVKLGVTVALFIISCPAPDAGVFVTVTPPIVAPRLYVPAEFVLAIVILTTCDVGLAPPAKLTLVGEKVAFVGRPGSARVTLPFPVYVIVRGYVTDAGVPYVKGPDWAPIVAAEIFAAAIADSTGRIKLNKTRMITKRDLMTRRVLKFTGSSVLHNK